MAKLFAIRRELLAMLSRVEFSGPFIARLSVGVMFAQSGWAKLHDLGKVIEFFHSIGIPFPELQAPFVAAIEFGCGLLVALGLGTRVAAIPLIATMVVAILTALRDQIGGIVDLLVLSEFTYIAVLTWLALAGPGSVSLDALLMRLLDRSTRPVSPPARALADRAV